VAHFAKRNRCSVYGKSEVCDPRRINPPLADRALDAELEVGLLLPCNVVVYEMNPSSTVVAAMAPLAALGIVGDNPLLTSVAREADERLRKALQALAESHERLSPEGAALAVP
jgi:hypothetical protein